MKHILAIFAVVAIGGEMLADRPGIIDTSKSPHVKIRSLPMDAVKWTDGFWARRFKLCHRTTIPGMLKALLDPRNAAQLTRLKVVAGLQKEGGGGKDWADGDCYKWIETMAHVYAVTKDPKLDKLMDEWIGVIAKAQDADGYISTNIGRNKKGRLQMPYRHELYNMGHLLTAACIHRRATGKDRFLRIARKLGDYLYAQFKPRPKRLVHFAWNPSQIMGLIELYRTTRDRRYLELAGIFVDNRGSSPGGGTHRNGGTDQTQDRVPLRAETQAVGHAVTGMYLYCGAADVYAETGDAKLLAALERIWTDVTARRMDITGGVAYGRVRSPRGDPCHEAFGGDYQLPNRYNETCANIANGMFSWRLLAITGDAKYADMMEKAAYNSLTAAIDLAGTSFFYCNPLVWKGDAGKGHLTSERWSVHHCYCCPPQVARTIAKLHNWAYGVSDDGLWVHLYGANVLTAKLGGDNPIKLTQETRYPWSGKVRLTINQAGGGAFTMRLRIPGWVRGAAVKVNGEALAGPVRPGTYMAIRRKWSAGDTIDLDFPMPVHLMEANPKAKVLRNYVAAVRGPIVYCLELPKAQGGEKIWRDGVFLPENAKLTQQSRTGFPADAVVLVAKALTHKGRDRFVKDTQSAGPPRKGGDWGERLYRPLAPRRLKPPTGGTVGITLIPYYAWANRGVSMMEVWIPLAR